MPVWLTVAAHFLIENDKLNLNKVLGLIIALAGLFLAVYEPTTGYDKSQLYGDAYSLMASLCWATIAIMLKTTRLSKATPETQLLYQLVIGFPFLVCMVEGYAVAAVGTWATTVAAIQHAHPRRVRD